MAYCVNPLLLYGLFSNKVHVNPLLPRCLTSINGYMNPLSHLWVNADGSVALLTCVGEHRLVALDAVRMIVPEHVALSCQGLVTLPAAEVARVPVLRHRLRVFSAENQLQHKYDAPWNTRPSPQRSYHTRSHWLLWCAWIICLWGHRKAG